ncbi:hypothetical protein ACFL6X_03215 [Candidatus Latescibacterota bacterium]
MVFFRYLGAGTALPAFQLSPLVAHAVTEIQEGLERQLDLERDAGDVEGQIAALESLAEHAEGAGETAACRRQQSEAAQLLLARARADGDLESQAAALHRMAEWSLDDEQRRACLEELVQVSDRMGDEWGQLEGRQGLERLAPVEPTTALDERHLDEILALADRLGDPRRKAEALSERAHRHLANHEFAEAARRLEEHAEAIAPDGDVVSVAQTISWAELARALAEDPDEVLVYRKGSGHLVVRDGVLASTGSGRSDHLRPFPPDPVQTPMSDFLWLNPFDGLALLASEVGQSSKGGHNTGLGDICETMRLTSTLKSRQEEAEAASGRFDACALVETVISTSEEGRPVACEELEMARGYFAGTKQVWFAPGVGVVRLEYRHANGFTTVAELVDYTVEEPTDAYLPMALDNRWRYRWQDQESGVHFEDVLRVAAHRDGQWELAFVTSAAPAAVTGR